MEVIFDTKNSVELKRKEELRDLIPKLSEEDPNALEVFNKLIDDWYLEDINTYTLALTNRISRIDEFGDLITNEKAYETKRKDKINSVHAFLEKNFWIIDKDYRLISSDVTIKKLVQKDLEKKDKSQEKKRPDFVFMSSKDNSVLVVVEIKRPSHKLKIEDGNQLMNYRSLLEEYLSKRFKIFKGFLIGNKLDSTLERNKKGWSEIKVKTYSEIIKEVRGEYEEHLKALTEKKDIHLKSKKQKN